MLAAVFTGSATAKFGGFGVAAYLPDPNDARTKDALLMIQLIGCYGPGASVSARAEGLTMGKPKSVPLDLVLVANGTQGQGDTFMLRRKWPVDGAWVLVLTAKEESKINGQNQTLRATSLVQVDRSGKVSVIDRPRNKSWDDAKVLPDGKTKLLQWTFRSEAKVVATNLVLGDLNTAVAYMLKGAPARH